MNATWRAAIRSAAPTVGSDPARSFSEGDTSRSPEPESNGLRQVARSAFVVGMPIVAGLGLSLIVSLALARWLGVTEFGTYSYVWSWVAILGTASVFGLDNTIVSRLPAYAAKAAWGDLKGLLRWSAGVTLLASLGLAVIAMLVLPVFGRAGQPLPASIWLVAAMLVPLTAVLRVGQSALRGLHRPVVSQLPDSVLIPILMLAFVAIGAWSGSIGPTADNVLLAQVSFVGIAVIVAALLAFRSIPGPARVAEATYAHRGWLMTSGRMFLLSTMTAVNGRIGILFLGIIAAPDVVGPYAVALRGSTFVALALNVTVVAKAAAISAAHGAGQPRQMQLLAGQMSRIALVGGLPVALVLILFGRQFLGLFGAGFEGAATALTILAVGELVNVAAGPVATLLAMTGHERDALVGLTAGTAINAGLCLILIPQWGINGAAVAAAASVVLWNLILLWYVRRRLAIWPSILAGSGTTTS